MMLKFHQYVLSSLDSLEKLSIPNPDLNKTFTEAEILKSIKRLKSGKATGPPDYVGNEFLKKNSSALVKSLCHLFNQFNQLTSGSYPTIWSTSIITEELLLVVVYQNYLLIF